MANILELIPLTEPHDGVTIPVVDTNAPVDPKDRKHTYGGLRRYMGRAAFIDSRPPGATDDASAGYPPFAFGLDTSTTPPTLYACVDNSTNSAIWVQIAEPDIGGGGDMLKSVYDSQDDGVVNAARSVPWTGVTGKPGAFTPAAHEHAIADTTGLQAALNSKAGVVSAAGWRVPTFSDGAQEANGVPIALGPMANSLAYRGADGVLEVGTPIADSHAVNKKYFDDNMAEAGSGDMLKSVYDSQDNGVVNAARSVPWTGVTDKPGTFTPAAHNHAIADITNLQSSLDGKAATAHNHAIADITNLQSALNNKADSGHSHAIADITNLQNALDGKADTAHNHNASAINAGTLGVARGGTGASTLTSGSYLRGNGTSAVQLRTPNQVLSDIGAAAASHTHTISDVTDLQAAILDPFYINPQGDGPVEIVFDSAMTLNLGAVRVRGTGTLSYQRSTNGTTFTTVTGSTSFNANDVLRINVTGYDTYLTLTIPRTA